MRMSVIISIAFFLVSGSSRAADNAACWDDPTRVEISCTPLTEKLLLSLKFASRQSVMKAMKAEGRPLGPDATDTVHFISNYRHGEAGKTGILNVTFRDGRAIIIQAIIDEPHIE